MYPNIHAKELVDKFLNVLLETRLDFCNTHNELAKELARTYINTRLTEIDTWFKDNDDTEVLSLWNHHVGQHRHLNEVKIEIEKL